MELGCHGQRDGPVPLAETARSIEVAKVGEKYHTSVKMASW